MADDKFQFKACPECGVIADEDCERLIVQLAGCLTAAEGHIKDPAKQGDYGWSPAYQAVLELRQERDALVAGSGA